jgi:NAD(P)-dependent dehydrogenase (short-subunit alcohol dehydrogenase family)
MGYLGKPEDVAEAAFFLATDASKYITGTSIRVDGGNAIGF